jgi:hypothetical protein
MSSTHRHLLLDFAGYIRITMYIMLQVCREQIKNQNRVPT